MGAGAEAFAVGTSLAGSIIKTSGEKRQEEERLAAIQSQETQERIAASQQAIERADELKSVVSSQIAAGAAKGLAPSSGNLFAIQTGTFNKFAQGQETGELELDLKESELNQESADVKDAFTANVANNLFEASQTAINAGKFVFGDSDTQKKVSNGVFDWSI